jgi:hypothetical protein
LPATTGGLLWQLLINLADEAYLDKFAIGALYGVIGRSLLLFALEPDPCNWDNDSRNRPAALTGYFDFTLDALRIARRLCRLIRLLRHDSARLGFP